MDDLIESMKAPRSSFLADRDFWESVEKTHEHGCWVWRGPRAKRGYGRWGKKPAHRQSWELHNGPIENGLWVLHYCDNPPCVNPRHLYLGTVVENVIDMMTRGRKHVAPLKTHCGKGHELIGENLRLAGTVKARLCRTCDNESSKEKMAAKRVASRLADPPPDGRISTAQVVQRFGIPHATVFSWRRLGHLSDAVRYRRESWWLISDIEAAVARHNPRKVA